MEHLLEEKISLLEEKDARIEKLCRVVIDLTEQNKKLKCINDCLLSRTSTLTCLESCDEETSPTLLEPLNPP
jgi:NAD kinase